MSGVQTLDRVAPPDPREPAERDAGPPADDPGPPRDEADGTFYCFPDFSAYKKDSQRLAELLLERVRVVTVPGKEFGMDGHLRLSYCGTIKEIMDGLERIKWALDPSAPNELFLGDRKLVRDWA